MSYQFLISAGAQGDMVKCRNEDSFGAATLTVLLRELSGGRRACETLADEKYSDDVIESVEPLWSFQKFRINAYRVRLVEMSKWRLIVGVDHNSKRLALFAVMPRSANYQADRVLWQRIEREYDAFGFLQY